MHLIFYHLRTESAVLERIGFVTSRTFRWDGDGVAAVMAYELVTVFMFGQRDIAVDAFGYIRTMFTLDIGGIATSVLEEYHLLSTPDFIANLVV